MNRGNLPIREVTFGRISDLLKPINHLEIRPNGEITADDFEQLGISFRTGKKDKAIIMKIDTVPGTKRR